MPVTGSPKAPPLPTPLARRLVRYVVGFGIAVGLGMAPFLGRVPGMESLLDLFPSDMRTTLLPFSVFLMGLVAVAVQFYSTESISRADLKRRFTRALIALLVGFFLFLSLHAMFVQTLDVGKGDKIETVSVVIGSSRDSGCGCAPTLSDTDCLRSLSLNRVAIDSCWGRPLRLIKLTLSLSYLLLTGGFAALIGLLLLQEDRRRVTKKRS